VIRKEMQDGLVNQFAGYPVYQLYDIR